MKHKLTWSLITINIVVFEIIFSMPGPLFDSTFDLLDFSWGNGWQVWRWFTSMFLHVSASHLFFNILALYFFGRVLEEEVGARKWLGIYFLSGLAGNLVYGLTSSMPAVGASGCIFGLVGAAMFIRPKELIRLYVFPLPLGLIAILYIISQVALAVAPAAAGVNVAYGAHIGGLAMGSALMFYFKPKDFLKGFLVMLALLVLLLILAPLITIVIDIGEMILSIFEAVVGFVLYGVARLLLSWIW